jgi:RNA polymerase sigma-70 factor (ECF subfamily)
VDDTLLVEGLRARSDDAVRAYLERYRPLFLHCISHFEQEPAARDDLLSELSWHALERLAQDAFDPTRGSFGTWLYRVAWCRCVDLKRQQNARRRIRLTTQGDDLPERADPTESLPERLAGAEIGSAVRRAMADLPDEERALLVLRFVEQRTLLDIAAALGITLEQAKYRLKRASVALRRELLSRLPKSEVAG